MTDMIGSTILPFVTAQSVAGRYVTLGGVCSTRAQVDAIRRLFRHVSAARVISLVGGREVFDDLSALLENVQLCSFDAEDVVDGWYLLLGLDFDSVGGQPSHHPFTARLWYIETVTITEEILGKTLGEAVGLATDLSPLLHKAGVAAWLTSRYLVYEDDETFWTFYNTGAGGYQCNVGEETTDKVSGTSSAKLTISSGSNLWCGVNHTWGSGRDWSNRDTLALYFKGQNQNSTLRVWLLTDGSNHQYWDITDDFTGWRRIELNMATPDSETGTFDPSSVTEIRVILLDLSLTPPINYFLDLTELVADNLVAASALAMDYGAGLITITLGGEAVMWAWTYNANTTTYTGETVDINDSGTNDVSLPPYQTSVVGDALYIGGDAFPDGLSISIGTAGVYAGITMRWEYWDGDSWEPLTVTLDETAFFTVAGTERRVEWTKPSDFAPNVVNGEEAYWVRCVVTAFTTPSVTTSPLGDQAWLFLEKDARVTYEHVIE